MGYAGKVALVTGGGSGMGRVAAQAYASTGAKVAVLDLNSAGMQETAHGHSGIHTYTVDITSADAVNSTVSQVEQDLGPIDRVLNCAAIMPFGKILEQDSAVIHKLMDINYGGLVNISKATLPQMVERGSGEFVSFASMAGIQPALLMGAYNATKAAVAMLTEVIYHENRDSGVTFACVCPPPVATPLLQQGKDTAWPKLLQTQEGDELQPIEVIEEIELSLEKGEFWVFPGKSTKMGYRLRRWFPNYTWNYIHKIEGW